MESLQDVKVDHNIGSLPENGVMTIVTSKATLPSQVCKERLRQSNIAWLRVTGSRFFPCSSRIGPCHPVSIYQ